MKSRKLATVFAVATSLAAQISAQSAPVAELRQPGAMMPAVSQGAPGQPVATHPLAPTASIQQPAPYAATMVAPPSAQPVAQTIQQPANIVPPTGESPAPLVAPPVQQPTNFAPAAATPNSLSAAPVVQQPSPFVAVGTPPASNAVLQQPTAIGPPPSAFASYYDEDEDDEFDYDDDVDYRLDEDMHHGDHSDCDEGNTCCGFDLGGWLQQGFTFNPYDPADGNNGTVVLNDLANQWMMNQLWFYANRDVDNGGCGWDWGGRFDVLYGTDGEYFQMVDGLEESWGQTGHYQVAILRFYYDIAYNDWTFRIGRWDTPVGYEPFDATESFFYSRSYNFYAQPGSLLGMFLTRHLNDQWSISAGLHRGDMQFDDTDGKDALGFIGGFSWLSVDEESWFDAYIQTDEEGIGVDAIDYSLIYGTTLGSKWDYVAEWYWGQNDQFGQQSDWYGLNQHFIREINDCWSHGFRFEWFRDDDGFIITDFARGNSAQGPFNGNFFEATYAINYQPCENFVLRPEVRYDWFDASAPSPRPFDDNTENDQFLLSIDAIYAF